MPCDTRKKKQDNKSRADNKGNKEKQEGTKDKTRGKKGRRGKHEAEERNKRRRGKRKQTTRGKIMRGDNQFGKAIINCGKSRVQTGTQQEEKSPSFVQNSRSALKRVKCSFCSKKWSLHTQEAAAAWTRPMCGHPANVERTSSWLQRVLHATRCMVWALKGHCMSLRPAFPCLQLPSSSRHSCLQDAQQQTSLGSLDQSLLAPFVSDQFYCSKSELIRALIALETLHKSFDVPRLLK